MENQNPNIIGILDILKKLDEEFYNLNYYNQAKFAIEQIGMWQQRFNNAKTLISKENITDTTIRS